MYDMCSIDYVHTLFCILYDISSLEEILKRCYLSLMFLTLIHRFSPFLLRTYILIEAFCLQKLQPLEMPKGSKKKDVSITMMSTNSFVTKGALSMTTLKLASGSSMERPSICLYVKPRESRMPWIHILPGENRKWKYVKYIYEYLINIWTYCHSLLIRVQHEAEATYGHSKWSRATRLVTVLLLHCFDDGHAEVDIGDTVIAFFIHLLPTKIRGMWKKAEACGNCSSYRVPVLPKNGWLKHRSDDFHRSPRWGESCHSQASE